MSIKINNLDYIDTDYSHKMRETYLRVKANYQICTSNKSTKNMFEKIMCCEQANSFYNSNFSSKRIGKIDGSLNTSLPKIYVTMHLGAYRITGGYLLENGINICIPVTKKVYADLHSKFTLETQSVRDRYGTKMEIVDIEETSGIIKLMRAVRNNYSILFYIDGNSGIGGMNRSDEKLLDYTFFKKDIKIRKGIALIAKSLNIPIVPIFTYLSYDNEKYATPNIKILEEIIVDQKKIDDKKLCIDIWDRFTHYIKMYPEQWEGWCYVDAFFSIDIGDKITQRKNINKLHFNSDRYDFLVNNEYYLYDLYRNILIKLSSTLYNYLLSLFENKIKISETDFRKKLKSASLAEDIIKNEILI